MSLHADLETEPPDTRSRRHFLAWTMRGRYPALATCIALGIVGTVAESLIPIGIGYALDAALDGSSRALLMAGGALSLLVCTAIAASVTRFAVAGRIRIQVTYRLTRLIGHHAADVAEQLPSEVPSGEVATTVAGDTGAIGWLPDAFAQFVGAVVAYTVVAGYLLSRSVPLGLLVLIGVPLLVMGQARLFRPLESRRRAHRDLLGQLTVLGSDIARGLRVLRGIGGEAVLGQRYRALSRGVRAAGVRVAGPEAALEASKILLPGVFLVAVTWLGARLALQGDIGAGDLVAFYGSAAFLVQPMGAVAGLVHRLSEAVVGADHVMRILNTKPVHRFRGVVESPIGARLDDPVSGVWADPSQFTTVVVGAPGMGQAIAARLAGLGVEEQTGRLGALSLECMRKEEVRRRIVLNDNSPYLFSGPLRDGLDPTRSHSDDQLREAVRVACAEDVVAGLDDGLDSMLGEGAHSLSGGQRQRIALVRALLKDPDYLVLVDPTSAVDVTTETEMARRLNAFRKGRSTVVISASPPLLEVADRVVFVDDEIYEGTHEQLRDRVAAYRELVLRGES